VEKRRRSKKKTDHIKKKGKFSPRGGKEKQIGAKRENFCAVEILPFIEKIHKVL